MNRFGLGDKSFDSRSYPARFLGKIEGKEEGRITAHFGKVLDVRVIGKRESSSLASAEERDAREEEETDLRDPSVSEGEKESAGALRS